jgi:integrase
MPRSMRTLLSSQSRSDHFSARFGTHTLRHTYRAWLDSVGTPVGVQQKLMRHTDVRTTMRYGDAFTSDMAEAHGKVVGLALYGMENGMEPDSSN